jgi:hypothetical protein
MNLTFSWDEDDAGEVGRSGNVVSLTEFRSQQAGIRRDPAELLPIRPAPALLPRQVAHRRRMLQHLGGVRGHIRG